MTVTPAQLVQHGPADALERLTQAATKQGVNYADIADKPLGGLVGYGMPFRDAAGVVGTGKTAKKIAGGMDWLADKLRYGTIPGTSFQPVNAALNVFDAASKGARSATQRAIGQQAFNAQEDAVTALRQHIGRWTQQMVKAGKVEEKHGPLLRQVLEGVKPVTDLPPELHGMAGEIRQMLDDAPARAKAAGVAIEKYVDPAAKFVNRYLTAGANKGEWYKSRFPFLRGIKGGTEKIRQIAQSVEPLLAKGATKKEVLRHVIKNFRGAIPEYYLKPQLVQQLKAKNLLPTAENAFLDAHAAGYQLPKKVFGKLQKQGLLPRTAINPASADVFKLPKQRRAVADWLSRLDTPTLQSGVYGNHVLSDILAGQSHVARAIARGQTVLDTLAQPGAIQPMSSAARQRGFVPLGKVFNRLGMNRHYAVEALSKATGIGKKQLQQHGVPLEMANYLRNIAPTRGKKLGLDMLDETAMEAGPIRQAADWVTNLTKTGLTTPWPNFHVRNRLSGFANNVLRGMTSKDAEAAADTLFKGGIVKGASQIPEVQRLAKTQGVQTLDDAKATDLLRELAYAHSVAPLNATMATQLSGPLGNGQAATLAQMAAEMPGVIPHPKPYRDILDAALGRAPGTTINPKKATIRGIGGATESTLGPLAAGERAGHYIESSNRLAPFIQRLQEGASAAQAAKEVGEAQARYANRYYTPTEREILSRVFPFYRYSRNMVPFVAKELTERPGGRMSQALRAINRGHANDPSLPEYVGETAAIPLAQGADGTKRYLTGLGLSFEDPLQLATPSLSGAGAELISRTNPLLKAPLEYITNQSFFQRGPAGGRALEDLDPGLGRTLANLLGRDKPVRYPLQKEVELALANLPTSKALTFARTATDKRKGLLSKALNLGTGLRVSDISPAAQDSALRARASQIEKQLGAKSYTDTYIPKDTLATLDENERRLAERLVALRKLLEARAKARAEQRSSNALAIGRHNGG